MHLGSPSLSLCYFTTARGPQGPHSRGTKDWSHGGVLKGWATLAYVPIGQNQVM